jgi:hypothetical protein
VKAVSRHESSTASEKAAPSKPARRDGERESRVVKQESSKDRERKPLRKEQPRASSKGECAILK